MLRPCKLNGVIYPSSLYNEQCQFPLKMETIIIISCDVLIYSECLRFEQVKELVFMSELTNFIQDNK